MTVSAVRRLGTSPNIRRRQDLEQIAAFNTEHKIGPHDVLITRSANVTPNTSQWTTAVRK